MAFLDRITSINRAIQCLRRKPSTDVYLSTLENCGTKWLESMLAYYFREKFNLEYELSNARVTEVIPRNHSDPRVDLNGAPLLRRAHHAYWFLYWGEKVILMVRELADSLMSAYDKMVKLHGDMEFDYFLKGKFYDDNLDSEYRDLHHRVRFLNRWARYGFDHCDVHRVRYEDVREDPREELARVIDFIGVNRNDELVGEAVDFCSRKSMKNRAEQSDLREVQVSVTSKESRDPDQYFDEETRVYFREYLRNHLVRDYGYDYDL